LYVLRFEKERMTLRVPTNKVEAIGMRKLSSDKTLREALDTLKGKPKVKRTMWSRRAQEYEAKINSGDLIAIAEVVRDLYRSDAQPEQSYSERQLYEQALDRMARELAAVQDLIDSESVKMIESYLAKGPKRGAPKSDEAGDGDQEGVGDSDFEAGVEEEAG
ncbi:MAG: CarD family transcriptional regulator, partial [bacterium]